MKKTVVTILIVVLLLLTAPLTLVLVGFCTPAQFDETYYGELSYMYNRLKSAKGRKIVLIGNSALAFGVRSDLMQEEFPDYEVINFGLYGAIGTTAMLDLSKVNIGEGDVIIVAPERNPQAQSLYFSAEDTWMAADSDFSMLGQFSGDNAKAMVGNFAYYTSKKVRYLTSGLKPSVDGVYMQSSFDDEEGNEAGYMTYVRPCNMMSGGYDVNSPADFSDGLPEDFAQYLNEYNVFVRGRGATLYYGFAPVNELALTDGTDAETFVNHTEALREQLEFKILGNPADYIMDCEWFYDTNFHMNSSGMSVYTDRLTDDIKAELGIATPNNIDIPEKPLRGAPQISDGDNTDAACFTYEDFDDGVRITGLTEKGRAKTSFIIPSVYEGKPVRAFTAETFAGNTSVTEITVQENVTLFYDGSFDGCKRLTRLTLSHANPNTVGVGAQLLLGAGNLKIYVKSQAYDLFYTHYNWGAYRDLLVRY